MRITIRDIGRIGLITDKLGHELPPQAWTNVLNVVFDRGYARRGRGDLVVHTAPTIDPYVVRPVTGSNEMVAYTNNAKWMAIDAGTQYDITRAAGDYTGTLSNKWTGGYFNGVHVFYNGVDTPQLWNPIATGTRLVNFSNWPAATSAAFMRSFKTYLICGDVTKSGTRFLNILKWSQAAIPGTEPASWDETDPSTFAGEIAINTGRASPLVEAVPLGDQMLLCKENGLALLAFVGGFDVMDYRAISSATGIVATECAKEFMRGQIIMLADDGDVLVTNGQSMNSVAEGWVRSAILSALQGATTPKRSWVGVDMVNHQVGIFVPTTSAPDQVWLWDYQNNTWSYRTIEAAYSGESGMDRNDSGTRYFDNRLQFGQPSSDEILHFNVGGEIAGSTAYTSRLERVGLAIMGQSFPEGQVKADPGSLVLIQRIYPIVEAPSGFNLSVYCGVQEEVNEAVTWGSAKTFVVGTDLDVEFDVVTRFAAFKFEATANVDWKFHGYSLDIEIVGGV